MLWSSGKHGLAAIVNCCGLIYKFFLLFAWKADDIWHLIIFNTCSCKAWNVPPWGILHCDDIYHFKAQIPQMTFKKYARSPAEWLESLYPLPGYQTGLKIWEAIEKNPDLCHFPQSSSVQCDQFTPTQVWRTIHKLTQNSKYQKIIWKPKLLLYFFAIWGSQ